MSKNTGSKQETVVSDGPEKGVTGPDGQKMNHDSCEDLWEKDPQS